MSLVDQVVAAVAVAGAALLAGFAGGWYAKGVKAERDQLQDELAQQRGARVLEARDRRTAGEASADYQAVLQQIRVIAAAARSKEENDALRTPIACAGGASAVELGDVPVPAVLVDGLRAAGADHPADRPAAR